MCEGTQIREGGSVQRSDHGATRDHDIRQPNRVTLSIAADIAPEAPGAYRFWDNGGRVLYVGKAQNLRNRIRNHLQTPDETLRHRLMIDRSETIDWIVAPNETEALLLEDMLIKRHHPDFNVRFRDDKRYPILRLDVTEEFPTLSVVRKFENDGALYYGPFTSGRTMRTILRVIERYFPLKRCKGPITPSNRECLNYQIKKCPGVCRGHVTADDYRQTVHQVQLLLSGRNDELIQRLEKEMNEFSSTLNFEAAALRRDQLESVRNVSGGRKLMLPRPVDLDVFCFDTSSEKAYGELLLVRSGMVTGNLHMHMRIMEPVALEKIASHCMIHYYRQQPPIPKAVLSNCIPEDKEAIELLLRQICGRSVKIFSRPQGTRNKLINLARSNLRLHTEADQRVSQDTLGPEALRLLLNLDRIPHRIEAIDISESQGKHVTGSVVSFLNGRPEKSRYRRYQIQSTDAISDLDRIREVMKRRLARSSSTGWNLPDLFLIDGGRLQLNAALSICRETGHDDLTVISIAKLRNKRQHESLFIKNGREIALNPDDESTKFLDRIRDEAHRFAITYHRMLRNRSMLRSRLMNISGIGPKRRKMLLETFGSIDGIKSTEVDAIEKLPGFTKKLANAVKAATNGVQNDRNGVTQKKEPGSADAVRDSNESKS